MNANQSHTADHIGPSEVAVLRVLVVNVGRVVSRANLTRMAGLQHLSSRRCDKAIVSLRRVLGPTAIETVRSRGWMLVLSALVEANMFL